MSTARIILFNVKYSPNLGDGLLVECLERELATHFEATAIESLDLAGRTTYTPGRPERTMLLSVLHASPLLIRQTIAKAVLGPILSQRLQPIWRRRLRNADVVVIGGGNLISDTDLNFPLKLGAAVASARICGVPVGTYAVGVSDNWTTAGGRLFAEALADAPLFYASVRDRRSAEIWKRRLSHYGGDEPEVTCDPGLLASLHFSSKQRPPRSKPKVGVGVMHPASLKYHSDQGCAGPTAQLEWTLAFVRACLAKGWAVRVFTNGSAEDEAYLKSLTPQLLRLDATGQVGVEPRFANPSALASFIASLDLLYAHRLHANIAAYSYGVPQIGFSWDVKLKSFLSEVGRGEYLANVGLDGVDSVVDMGAAQLREGLDLSRHHVVLDRARSDVAHLASAIETLKAGSSIPGPSANA